MNATGATDRAAAVRHVRRASGQVAALGAMVADGRPFAEVAQQLLAARGSLDSLLIRLVEIELDVCLPAAAARAEVDCLLRSALGRNARKRDFPERPHTRRRAPNSRTGGLASP